MWCDGCRREVLASWELGDGSRLCHACIVEQTATAEAHELNRRLAAVLDSRPRSVAESAVSIHASAHLWPTLQGCPRCERKY